MSRTSLDRASSLPSSPRLFPSFLYVFTNSLTRFVVSFCHPRPRSGIQGLGGALFGKTQDDTQVVPYGLMVSVCRGGPGCPPFLSFLLRGFGPARRGGRIVGFRPHTTRGRGLRGFAPARRGPFVSAKGPKTSGARAGPPRGGSCAPVPGVWAAELATLRQSSPLYGMDGTGAQPRPQAPGTSRYSFRHARLDRASRVVGLLSFLTQCGKLYKTYNMYTLYNLYNMYKTVQIVQNRDASPSQKRHSACSRTPWFTGCRPVGACRVPSRLSWSPEG